MLTDEEWKKISKQASKIYSELELELIEEISKRIASVGYANSVVENQVKIAQQIGIMYEEIIDLVAKYNNTSYSKIKKIFFDASINSLNFDNSIYKEMGLNPTPLLKTPYLLNILESSVRKVNYNLNNLVMTTAETTRNDFYNAINKAYIETTTGIKSYSQSIIDAVKEIEKIDIKYPTGVRRSVESAVRMNILTGISQTCGKMQEQRANELGWDLMELTAHIGARPSHAEWQGKIVSLSGQKGYLSKEDIGYGTVDGFKGVNCRHDWFPYYKGSKKQYTNQELEEMKNQTVKYNNKEISYYKATQIQRHLERTIRKDKKEKAKWQGILKSNNIDLQEQAKKLLDKANSDLRKHNKILNNFINQTGLEKDDLRTKI